MLIKENNLENISKKKLIDMIIDLEETYYRVQKINIKSKELFGSNIKLKNKLKKIRKNIIMLNNALDKIDSKKSRNRRAKIDKIISSNQIIKLDFNFQVNTYELFNQLKYEDDLRKRLNIVNQLKKIYFDIFIRVYDEFITYKNQIKEILSFLSIISKEDRNEIVLIDSINRKLNEKTKTKNNEYIKKINDTSILQDTYDEVKDKLLYFIKSIKLEKIDKDLIDSADDIINTLSNIEDINIKICMSNRIIDSIKSRKRNFKKEDEEKSILNIVMRKFKNFKELAVINNNNIDSVSTSYLYDIISTLLYDEKGYLPIKKILSKYKNALIATSNGKNILEYIVDLYLLNYEKVITGDKINYINIDYLKEVYYLFVNDLNFNPSPELISKIDTKIKTFISRLTVDKNEKQVLIDDVSYNTLYIKNDRRKNIITEELTKLSTFDLSKKLNYEEKSIEDKMLDEQINTLRPSNTNNQVDLTKEKNIMLDDNFTAYNFKITPSSKILRISVPDISSMVQEYSMVDNYMYNKMLDKGKIDKRILDKLKFKNLERSSAITFKITFDKNNEPIDLYIYKSNIIPSVVDPNDKMYSQLLDLSNDLEEKNDYYLNLNDNDRIKINLRNLVNKMYLEYAKKYKIPIIYSGIEKVKSISTKLYMNLVPILDKLTKEEVKNLYDILVTNLGEFHYSDKKFDVVGDYDLNLIGKPNYILLENQRIIKSLIINSINNGNLYYDMKKDAINDDIKKILSDLNASINYKDVYTPELYMKRS